MDNGNFFVGFPLSLWINIDDPIHERRRQEMMKNFSRYNIRNIRISAVYGKYSEQVEAMCIPSKNLTMYQTACTCSHFKALEYFIKKTLINRVMIFEDDVSFELIKYIPFPTWKDFEDTLPADYGIVQLAVITTDRLYTELVKWKESYTCTAAYLIKRDVADGILKKYYRQDIGKYDFSECPPIDLFIYKDAITYTYPMFIPSVYDDSLATPDKIPLHRHNAKITRLLWERYDMIRKAGPVRYNSLNI